MNVKDTIQALQSVIDELSYHPADTKLKLQTSKLTILTHDMKVEHTGDVVTVTIPEYVKPTTSSTPDDDDDYWIYGCYP